ncbi:MULTISPECIES: hypothetical protein [Nocardia]|uniref:Uncharacterized protein n=1 Tax=Nocardia africana TaxID=134964 RepID=A0A378WJU5_9NOCA|nr:hypothetical protein [Nocardia africana]MCC3317977.1 hypothetical protein [Nocardia africana]SUA40701.1 Uncharacterised protein [Nocardia africana]
MASLQNHFRVIAETHAAATEVTAAEIVGTAEDIVSARSPLARANLAFAAIVDGPTELGEGQPVLWINTFGADSGEPIGILKARILAEIVPRGLHTGQPQRKFLALLELPGLGHVERIIGADDILALPDPPHTPDSHPGPHGGADVAELVRDAFGEDIPTPGNADSDPRPPSLPEPDTGYGLE